MDFNAYAKINLSLDVTEKLSNGYHSVAMVMQSVELCDVVSIEKNTNGTISVVCDNPQIPDGKDNLAYRACELMKSEFDISEGFDIRIKKNIPVAGGMAGGSTDAAAVMRGINEMSGSGATTEKLMELGVTLGADIPFCIQKKCAFATGIGEVLTPVKGLSEDLFILLVNPNISVSTKEIYQLIDNEKMFNTVDNKSLISALENGEVSKYDIYMKNAMQDVTTKICPEISDIIKGLKGFGANAALMSGSGATCYGIFKDEKTALEAQRAFDKYFTAITHALE